MSSRSRTRSPAQNLSSNRSVSSRTRSPAPRRVRAFNSLFADQPGAPRVDDEDQATLLRMEAMRQEMKRTQARLREPERERRPCCREFEWSELHRAPASVVLGFIFVTCLFMAGHADLHYPSPTVSNVFAAVAFASFVWLCYNLTASSIRGAGATFLLVVVLAGAVIFAVMCEKSHQDTTSALVKERRDRACATYLYYDYAAQLDDCVNRATEHCAALKNNQKDASDATHTSYEGVASFPAEELDLANQLGRLTAIGQSSALAVTSTDVATPAAKPAAPRDELDAGQRAAEDRAYLKHAKEVLSMLRQKEEFMTPEEVQRERAILYAKDPSWRKTLYTEAIKNSETLGREEKEKLCVKMFRMPGGDKCLTARNRVSTYYKLLQGGTTILPAEAVVECDQLMKRNGTLPEPSLPHPLTVKALEAVYAPQVQAGRINIDESAWSISVLFAVLVFACVFVVNLFDYLNGPQERRAPP